MHYSDEDFLTLDTVEVMREELEQAVSRLKNGKSAGSDDIVAELVRQEMIDWLWELLREIWRTRQVHASRMEECHTNSTSQDSEEGQERM